jgi:hypothetical protein
MTETHVKSCGVNLLHKFHVWGGNCCVRAQACHFMTIDLSSGQNKHNPEHERTILSGESLSELMQKKD